MSLLEPFLYNSIWVFITVLARISPLLMLLPPLRGPAIPMRIRAMVGIAITAVITPLVYERATEMPTSLPLLAIAVVCELLLGLMMGVVVVLIIGGMQMGGQFVSQIGSMEMADAADALEDNPMPVLSQVFGWLGIALFLFLGGHRYMLDGFMQSFARYPAGSVAFQEHWLEVTVGMLIESLIIGIRVGAPIAIALLISNLITGLLARTVPQINILAVGFNINAMVMLTMVFLSIGGIGWVFQHEMESWLENSRQLWSNVAPASDSIAPSLTSLRP
jgi:flagellar biosynthesis protein FliR